MIIKRNVKQSANKCIVVVAVKKPCSPGCGLLLFSSTPRNETGDMPRENYQTVPVTHRLFHG